MFSKDFARKQSGICTTPLVSICSLLYHSSVNKVFTIAYPFSSKTLIAFSLVAVQVAEGEDAEAVAEAMKSGIDPRKWICVEANDLLVATSGDIALLVMLDSNSGLTAQSFVDAFNTVVAG